MPERSLKRRFVAAEAARLARPRVASTILRRPARPDVDLLVPAVPA